METNKIKGAKAKWFKKGKKKLSRQKIQQVAGPSSKPVLDHYES